MNTSNKNNIRTVIFDMDGVIFDTENVMKRFWQEEADLYNFGDITPLYLRCVGTTETFCADLIAREYPMLPPYEAFKQRPNARFREYNEAHGMPLKPYVRELLDALRAHEWKIGLASSTVVETVRRELAMEDLLGFFDVVIGGDLLKRSKPAPDIYLMACEKIGTKPDEAYAIEDSHNGIRAAYAAGMHPIMVPDLLPATEEMLQKSEIILPSLRDVKDYFFGSEVMHGTVSE